MKISYSAFVKTMTVNELFYQTILYSYNKLKVQKLIKNPWPKIDKEYAKKLLDG